MAYIVPTVTPTSLAQFIEQTKRLHFADRIHLDFMDGHMTNTHSPSLTDISLPHGRIDLHLMFQQPIESKQRVIELKPDLVIIHAEADGNFLELADAWHQADIKVGVALLPDTPIEIIEPALSSIDHVLIFSGSLGSFGGTVDLRLLQKVAALKSAKSSLEIGWDGGINDSNIEDLIAGGVDVLNVGGYIQRAADPQAAYAKLKAIVDRDQPTP